jgi:triosephosphate isomerase
MRKNIVAGNWKMNNSLEEGLKLVSEVVNMAQDEVPDDVLLVIAPPFTHLDAVSNLVEGHAVLSLGAQNCNENKSGAYTGEISVEMLKSVGAEFVIIGHSERREYFNESDELLGSKVDVVLEYGLRPIFCCGESLEIREAGNQVDFVCGQLTNSLFHLSENEFKNIVIAYEPIWAIGTGVTASSEQAQDMHAAIRNHLESKFGSAAAEECSILYGGSCKPSNAEELFSKADVDGGLIGGASLNSADFIGIARSF